MSASLFENKHGKTMSVSELNTPLHGIFEEIQQKYAHIIPDSVKIEEVYSIYKLLQRGDTSESEKNGISEIIINVNN